MCYDANEWHVLHNTTFGRLVWHDLVNGNQVSSRIWGMKDLVHIEAELRHLGLRYQVMAGISLWGKIAQLLPKVAYNSPVYVLVSWYDNLWPYLFLYY